MEGDWLVKCGVVWSGYLSKVEEVAWRCDFTLKPVFVSGFFVAFLVQLICLLAASEGPRLLGEMATCMMGQHDRNSQLTRNSCSCGGRTSE